MGDRPYTKTFAALSTLAAGSFHTLQVPGHGEVVGFIITQETGNLDGYVVNLYTSVACVTAAQTGDLEHYRVFPAQTAAGAVKTIVDRTGIFPYMNRDGNSSAIPRKLYLHIDPVSTGTKVFQVTLIIKEPLS